VSNTHHWRPVTESTALARHDIEMRMRAIREHVPGLRAMAAEQAMRSDHDLDFIDDVRLAVDEVCAIMLATCTSADVLTVRMSLDPNRFEISAHVPMRVADTAGGLSLRVLQALADALDLGVDDTDDEPVFRLRFCRQRPARHA
jgi:serine/threonine-protein kinase RsbW